MCEYVRWKCGGRGEDKAKARGWWWDGRKKRRRRECGSVRDTDRERQRERERKETTSERRQREDRELVGNGAELAGRTQPSVDIRWVSLMVRPPATPAVPSSFVCVDSKIALSAFDDGLVLGRFACASQILKLQM